MNLEFRKPTEADGKEIVTWKYDGEYSFYNNDKTEAKSEWARNIHKEENAYTIYSDDQLIGNCSFDYDEEEGKFILGVQMRPNLTGKGTGTDFVKTILEFGRETYNFDYIQLLVATFNKRAIRIYEKLGFNQLDEFVWNVNGEKKEFISMGRSYEN